MPRVRAGGRAGWDGRWAAHGREPEHAGGEGHGEPGQTPVDTRGHSGHRHPDDPGGRLTHERPGEDARALVRGRPFRRRRDRCGDDHRQPAADRQLRRGERDEAGCEAAAHRGGRQQAEADDQQAAQFDPAGEQHQADCGETAGDPGYQAELTGGGGADPELAAHLRQRRRQDQDSGLGRKHAGE